MVIDNFVVAWFDVFAGAKVFLSIAAYDVGSITFAAYHAGRFPDTLDGIVYVDWFARLEWDEGLSTRGDYTALLGFPDASTLLLGVVRHQDAVMPTLLLEKVGSCVVFFRRATRMVMEFCCRLV